MCSSTTSAGGGEGGGHGASYSGGGLEGQMEVGNVAMEPPTLYAKNQHLLIHAWSHFLSLFTGFLDKTWFGDQQSGTDDRLMICCSSKCRRLFLKT